MGMTIAEKILAEASGRKEVKVGDIIDASVDAALVHEITGPLVYQKFYEITDRVWDPDSIVITIDHSYPADTIGMAENNLKTVKFVEKQGIKHFYPYKGICHQILVEQGHARPGTLIVGADSHTCTAGAMGSFAVGVGSTDMAGVFVRGKLWLRVPETFRFNINGSFPIGVMAKDLVLHMMKIVGQEGATYKAVEYAGPTIRDLSIGGRMVLANMAVEMGAKTGIVEADLKTIKYLKKRASKPLSIITSDPGASYERMDDVDVSTIEPLIAFPPSPENVKPVAESGVVEIDQAFIGSCTGGRMEDLRVAAKVLNGEKVRPYVKLLIIPASREIYLSALREGLLETFLEAGATIMNPNCGPCAGIHQGVLASGETCVSTQNRNFPGRMGSSESRVYLANPATVAASAIDGKISDPRKYLKES